MGVKRELSGGMMMPSTSYGMNRGRRELGSGLERRSGAKRKSGGGAVARGCGGRLSERCRNDGLPQHCGVKVVRGIHVQERSTGHCSSDGNLWRRGRKYSRFILSYALDVQRSDNLSVAITCSDATLQVPCLFASLSMLPRKTNRMNMMYTTLRAPLTCRSSGSNSNSTSSTDDAVSVTSAVSEKSPISDDPAATAAAPVVSSPASPSVNTASASDSDPDPDDSLTTTLIASSLFIGLALLVVLGVVYKDPISTILSEFMIVIEALGPRGYALFVIVYTLLEVLAVPAAPLTMTAGVLFGVPVGASLVLVSATMAACISFTVTRYLARDKVNSLIKADGISNKWKAVDRAIGRDGFRVVLLLRLSPLLPFALSNYLYGLTSVPLSDYALGSFLGMIPGTVAYVAAGTVGKKLLLTPEGGGSSLFTMLPVAFGVMFSFVAATYITKLAKKALDEATVVDADTTSTQ